jgi:hypothetical protein
MSDRSRGQNVIEMHLGAPTQMARDFDELVTDFSGLVADYELHLQAQASKRNTLQPLPGFQRNIARLDTRRKRF